MHFPVNKKNYKNVKNQHSIQVNYALTIIFYQNPAEWTMRYIIIMKFWIFFQFHGTIVLNYLYPTFFTYTRYCKSIF